jgi:hypothetical protein
MGRPPSQMWKWKDRLALRMMTKDAGLGGRQAALLSS